MAVFDGVIPAIIGATNATSAGYEIERSLRFNSADSAYLNRTPSSAGNRRTWTWSGWVKRAKLSVGNLHLFDTAGSPEYTGAYFTGSDTIEFRGYTTGFVWRLTTTPVFRDPSSWYHIVFVFDSTNATSSDRLRLYINGVRITTFSTSTYPSLNYDSNYNNSVGHTIGSFGGGVAAFDGYLAEIYSIDGQALAPTDFGEFDSNNVWQPKEYSGTYGTNGFHLDFSDNSTAAALGTDTSGNGNNWTVNNISVAAGAGNDSLVDSPTNGTQTDTGAGGEVVGNYATWNPLTKTSVHTLSNGNLDVATSNTGTLVATIFLSSGKWYWEVNSDGYVAITGVDGVGYTGSISASGSDSYGYWNNGSIYSGIGGQLSGGASFSYSDTIGIALDIDGNNVKFYKNGVQQFSIALNYSGWEDLRSGVFPSINGGTPGTKEFTLNAGQRPFAYTAPSGYKALCTANLPDPTIADGSTAMDVALYTGNDTARSITGLNIAPDVVWIKKRSGTGNHSLADTVRGATKNLVPNDTNSESTEPNYVTAFNSDGFSLGTSSIINNNGDTYVSWNWDAGTSTESNTDGSITSSVRANQTAGLSIVTWTRSGGSNTATIGHGLNAVPELIILKDRDTSTNWYVGSPYIDPSRGDFLSCLNLNLSTARFNNSDVFTQGGAPSSSVFGVGAVGNPSGDNLAYCFAPVEGYSAFGSYTGNANADGPFVYTGFRPKWVLIRCSSVVQNWVIIDAERNTYNIVNNGLYADLTNAEQTSNRADFTSNGFKIRTNSGELNTNSGTHLYAAFAEHPFKTARAR